MAIGDALGLACEGLGPGRQRRLFPQLDGYHFLFGHGMVSDDTEHACMTARALLSAPTDERRFASALAWQLRLWLLCLPAGVGLATLRACVKLWLGWPPARSGVFSAGNGPAMRAPLLGVALGHDPEHDPERLLRFLRASTRLTHRDPKAEAGALAVALAASLQSRQQTDPQLYLTQLRQLSAGHPAAPELLELLEATVARLDLPPADFLAWLGCSRGISGYMLHTVPAVIWFWLRDSGDFQATLVSAIRCGGDTDTVAAILGGILGAGMAPQDFPPHLLKNLAEWPRSLAWMQKLSAGLAESLQGRPARIPRLNPLALLARNLVFLLIVLTHGFRRLIP